ncbi:MAG: nucleotidyltransferase domain-containing protein [Mariprofundaceae bacterium]|nr:nucleotidyltransferase domain-containing protein [Mariprofundaceae bacterium]
MRLTDFQRTHICQEVMSCFGSKSHVWLFGSRVHDHQKGGDIDLYIEPELQGNDTLVNAKLHFLMNIHRLIGEQKIDVVLYQKESHMDLAIYHIAKETGVLLQ